jgi:hypothetical protein
MDATVNGSAPALTMRNLSLATVGAVCALVTVAGCRRLLPVRDVRGIDGGRRSTAAG